MLSLDGDRWATLQHTRPLITSERSWIPPHIGFPHPPSLPQPDTDTKAFNLVISSCLATPTTTSIPAMDANGQHAEKLQPQRAPDQSKTKDSFEGHDSFIERRSSPRESGSARELNAKLANPLAGISHEQLLADAADFARQHALAEHTETIQKGALLAQDPGAFETLPMLTEADRTVLRREFTHKWDQPKTLYYMVVMCSIAAAVQGVRISSLR